jgi:hypothetical protein
VSIHRDAEQCAENAHSKNRKAAGKSLTVLAYNYFPCPYMHLPLTPGKEIEITARTPLQGRAQGAQLLPTQGPGQAVQPPTKQRPALPARAQEAQLLPKMELLRPARRARGRPVLWLWLWL